MKFMFFFIIPVIIFMVGALFMENLFNESSESAFECGFEPISFSRVPFSLQFFSITIVFLIFDLEIVIILPLVEEVTKQMMMSNVLMTMMIFFLILGLLVEWFDGSLNWEM